MGLSWDCHGIVTGLSGDCHQGDDRGPSGDFQRFSWDCQRTGRELSEDCHWVVMGLSVDCHGSVKGLSGDR